MAHMMHHGHHVEHHSPVYHPPEYKNPASGYAKPAHGASLEEIFGVHTAYHPSVPVTVHKPAYHAPKPAYHAPEPAYHAPEPAYHAPEPAYHAPKPAYEPVPVYKPNYKHPTGDVVSVHANHAGHPFSLEQVFGIGMPGYYMKKYPHMAHMMHHGHHLAHPVDNYVEPKPAYHEPKPAYHEPKPAYHPPKVYDHPKSGYNKPAHGASLEEIFGVHTAYHPHPKPAYHEPAPAYHPPEPAYHPPQPAYAAPQP